MTRTGITPLPVQHRHALHVATLPPRHRDPFDRLLVAQAQLEGLPILTADRSFALYDVETLGA
jgi:PIN domain nuclease of toxin-antitoxin system